MKNTPRQITRFARHILGKPLYPYQAEIAEAVLDSILGERGRIFTVMMARQSGKNQLSAVIEAYLLACCTEGTIVKAAPTFTPQIINSRLRLLSLLDTPLTRKRIWTKHGYIVGLAPQADPALLRTQAGPRVMFYSAGLESNVVGATADLLLEIDEAQDVAHEKFDHDFRPMAAVKNATTILYGTAWSDDTLLAQQRAVNLALEQQTGVRCHFEYDWRTLAAINPAYRTFVEQEIARLGEDHLAIQTHYFLRPISGAGYLLNPLQRTLLQGTHTWEETPSSEGWYIAGMDVAGEDRPGVAGSTISRHSQRDSTVITIGWVYYNELQLPSIEVVHHQWWTGCPTWNNMLRRLPWRNSGGSACWSWTRPGDSGGAGLAALLLNRLGADRIIPFTFTRPSKSRLAYALLALLNSGRLKLYAAQHAPQHIYQECWQQLRLARYRLPAPEVLDMYVEPSEGHDDFLISLALLTEGIALLTAPAASTLIHPRKLYEQESQF